MILSCYSTLKYKKYILESSTEPSVSIDKKGRKSMKLEEK
ncbi:hypothetical protein AC7_2511 [Clostridium perfringens NCTC 8239]|nr:hypothetical protein AC7_2511 [Clostridium perfringens NCTC 8239]